MPKWLVATLSALLALAVVVSAAGFIVAQRSLTPQDGTVNMQGLSSEVRIYRDSWGVPHIYAGSEADLFFAQGYVQAQDRLWQMETHRRMGSGTLSEIVGDSTLDYDRFFRTIGLRRYAFASYEGLDPDMKEVLRSYCRGVNAFIHSNKDSLPLEFMLLGFTPADWDPADCLTVSGVIAWELGKNWEVELTRAQLIQKLGPDKAGELLAPYPADSPVVVPPELTVYPIGSLVASGLHLSSDCLGSNNWVVDGTKTVSGKPMLANDPHLAVMMPSIWYETGLHGAGFDVVGVSLPGCPLVHIGRNNYICWGITNLPADTQDFFIEKLDPGGSRYEYKGQWKELQVIEETISVRGRSQPEVLKVRLTGHGPLMDNVIKGLEQPLALQWVGQRAGRLMKSVYMLDRARNWTEFNEALELWDFPSQNIVYADSDGNIGYRSTGLIPVRSRGNGTVPVPGWIGDYDWNGFIPQAELPGVFNPPSHCLVTANNKVVSDNYSHFMAWDWSPPYRAQRITDLLSAKDKLSVQDFKDIQADTYDIPASIITPFLLEAMMADSRGLQEPLRTARESQAMDILKRWDFFDRADDPAPAIYQVLYVKLLKNVLQDKLGGALFRQYLHAMGGSGDVHGIFITSIIGDNNSFWFDDPATAGRETRDDVIRKSFKETLDELSAKFGQEPGRWKWGDIHTTWFRHALGRVPGLDFIFSRGPIPTPGSRYTVDVAAFDYDNPYSVVALPSYRQIVDWSNPGVSLAMHTTGQSGISLSAVYDNMLKPWLEVEYHPVTIERADVEKAGSHVLVLMP